MKGPLAAAVEAVRSANEAGLRFRGDVVICAHGLHEAPGGHGEDLTAALHAGAIQGDAAVVLEIGHNALPLAGLGCAIYRAAFRRPGPVTHELMTTPGAPNPAYAVAEAAVALRGLAEQVAARKVERIGGETLFLGQIHCGDFYNRFPNEAWLEGTRRWAPESSAEAAAAEMRAALEPIAAAHGLELEFRFEKIRDGFRISEEHPLVGTLRSAYQDETGRELPLTGIRIVADAPLFEKEGGIPCVYHGLESNGAHGDLEWVSEAELRRGARVYLRLMAAYLGIAAS
jgi:acetylornithine deacetylase/succinyl-diaminopimelate desuccinylase-like protein